MYIATFHIITALIIQLIITGAIIYLFFLLVKALKKYLSSKEVREEKREVQKTLGEALKEHRIQAPQIYWLSQGFMESLQRNC